MFWSFGKWEPFFNSVCILGKEDEIAFPIIRGQGVDVDALTSMWHVFCELLVAHIEVLLRGEVPRVEELFSAEKLSPHDGIGLAGGEVVLEFDVAHAALAKRTVWGVGAKYFFTYGALFRGARAPCWRNDVGLNLFGPAFWAWMFLTFKANGVGASDA